MLDTTSVHMFSQNMRFWLAINLCGKWLMVISLYLEKWRPHLAVRWEHPRTTMIKEHYFGSIQTSLHTFAFLLGSTSFTLRQSLWISQVSEGLEQTPRIAPRGVWPGPDVWAASASRCSLCRDALGHKPGWQVDFQICFSSLCFWHIWGKECSIHYLNKHNIAVFLGCPW